MAAAAAARSAAARRRLRGLLRHFLVDSSASSWTRAAQRASAARGSDLRYDLELTLEEAFAGVRQDDHHRGAGHDAKPCDGVGLAGRQPAARPARPAAAPARSAPSRASSSSSAAAPAAGLGRDDRRSLHRLRRRRPGAQAPQAQRQHPGRGRRRHPHPRRGRGRGGGARRAVRRPLHVRPHEAARDLRARRNDAGRRSPISFTTAALGRLRSPFPGIDGEKIEHQDSRRDPVGRDNCVSAARE